MCRVAARQAKPADVVACVRGALASISVIVALVSGVRRPFRMEEPARHSFSAMHLPSVPVALAAGWGVTVLIGGVADDFLSALIAVALYQLPLAVEVGSALVDREQSDADEAVRARRC